MSASIEIAILKILKKEGKYPLYELSQRVCSGSPIAQQVQEIIDKMKKQGLVEKKGHCVEFTIKGIERASLVLNG